MEKATRQQTKDHNINLVFKTIYAQGDISRADVARITHLTRTTVSDIVADLIEQGYLSEAGTGESAGGKPPILLHLNENARQIVSLDLSGADYSGAILNLKGKICDRQSVTPRLSDGKASLDDIYLLAQQLLEASTAPVLGIAVALPGLIDVEKGDTRRSVHLKWEDVPLQRLMQEHFRLPVYLINDSHAAALAEFTFGEMRSAQNLIVVRIGEGIGSGIILSGRLHYGDGYGAGEIGHLTVVDGGRQCSCGNYGCLETVASPPAIIQHMQELAEYEWISFTDGGTLKPEAITWDFVQSAYNSGDETVIELIKEAGRYLGISIANLVSILNLHRIVISGRYVEFDSLFLEAVSSEVKRRSLFTMAAETQIVNSVLGPENVLMGASALVLQKEIGLP
jgi:predicted NBD/HSP70 family sugar kinase